MIYEGEFLKGRKIESNKNEIEFDISGEIIQKLYDDHGSLVYEGVYIDGKFWNGKGKIYYYNDKENSTDFQRQLIFEGEYLYNFIKKGKAYFQGKLEFEGDYFFYDKWNGKGYDKDGNVIYELKNGTGKIKKN